MANKIQFTRLDDTWDTVSVTNYGNPFPARRITLIYDRDAAEPLEHGIDYAASWCSEEDAWNNPNCDTESAPIFPGEIRFTTMHKGTNFDLIVRSDAIDADEGVLQVIRYVEGIEQDITNDIMIIDVRIDSPADSMSGVYEFVSKRNMFGKATVVDRHEFI